jgi:hypothetical protein
MNKKGGRSKIFTTRTQKHQVDLAADQHLLNPLSSPFLGMKFLYDYGLVVGYIFIEMYPVCKNSQTVEQGMTRRAAHGLVKYIVN